VHVLFTQVEPSIWQDGRYGPVAALSLETSGPPLYRTSELLATCRRGGCPASEIS
jgi:hypothetical protein